MPSTSTEYLLDCLSEELSEVIKEIGKCKRFTPDHTPVGIYTTSNIERVGLELADVFAIISMINEIRSRLPSVDTGTFTEEEYVQFNKKIEKTRELSKISFELGVLNAPLN